MAPAYTDNQDLVPSTMLDLLDGQRTNGAAAAMLPTDWLGPGARKEVAAMVTAANAADRIDTNLG